MAETVKPIKISKRLMPDGTYNVKPVDPEYFKKYYHKQGYELTTCSHCGVECRKNYMFRHKKTDKCAQRMRRHIEAKLIDLKNSEEI